MTTPTGARGWLDLVCEAWSLLFDDVVSDDPLGFSGYKQQLQAARAATSCSESVLVADAVIHGRRAIVVAFEFGFLGGSMGIAAGERICRAFETAAADKIPLIALTASGGARMQEGMLALAQMPATLLARRELAEAHQPFIAYLRNPTTGGVLASFASSADLLWAEPGATIGFAGPRVVETVTGQAPPADSHTAESALAAALLDEIIEPEQLRARLDDALGVLDGRAIGAPPAEAPGLEPDATARDPLEIWRRARDPSRPTGAAYLEAGLPLRRGGVDDTVQAAIMKIGQYTVVAIAQDARSGSGRTTPAGYRRARRAIATAARLGLPIVTLVDTPGADPSPASERDGVASEIAITFEALLGAPVPTVACVVGEGGSGGALALAACDRLLIQRNAVFSVIAPDAAASILRRDDLDEVARALRLTSEDLLALGLADGVIDEPGNILASRAHTARAIADAIGAATIETPSARRTQRWQVYGR